MDKSLDKSNLPKLNQEQVENINRLIMKTDIERVILNLPSKSLP
jgi:hypothetical protein